MTLEDRFASGALRLRTVPPEAELEDRFARGNCLKAKGRSSKPAGLPLESRPRRDAPQGNAVPAP